MADKITETDVVQIQAQDSDGNKYSFNVENPKASTTIANVREAFQPLINSGKWISKQGFPFSYIPQATLTKTKKIQLDDGASAVTVTPAEYYPTTGQETQTVTFTVDGSPIQGFQFKDLIGSSNEKIKFSNPILNTTNNTFTITIETVTGSTSQTTNLKLVTTATVIEVPIHNYK